MEVTLNNKKSPRQVVPSSCSCPSCDSLECFSKRYNNGLKICSCSKCTLTNCRYMSREEPTTQTSTNKVKNSCIKDYDINDVDVERIDVVVIEDTGYGEIKDKIFKDHTERIVIKKASSSTQTNTKFKKSSSSDIVAEVPDTCTKNVPTRRKCKTYRKLNKDAKDTPSCICKAILKQTLSKSNSIKTSSKSKAALEQTKNIKEFPSNTVVHDETTKISTKTIFKEYKTTILKNNTAIKDSSPRVICEELHEQLKDTSKVLSKSNKAKPEEVQYNKNPSSRTTCAKAVQEQMKGSNVSIQEQNKDIRALPSNVYKAVQKEKKDDIEEFLHKTCALIGEEQKSTNEFLVREQKTAEESSSHTSSPLCVVLIKGDTDADALPTCTTSESAIDQKKYSKNSTVGDQIKSTEESSSHTLQELCVDHEEIKNIMVFPTKTYEVIHEDDRNAKDFPPCATIKSVGELKRHTDNDSRKPCTTCGIYLEEINDTKGFPIKSYKVVRVENKYVKDLQPCARSVLVDGIDEKKDAIDSSFGDKIENIKEIPCCTSCQALLEQKRDTKEFPSKPYCITRKKNHERDTNISQSGTKLNALPEPTNSKHSQKLLTKQEIYDRILKAYKNCTCQVCECTVVTLNDVSTLKLYDSCECKPCECLKEIAIAQSIHPKLQSGTRLSALTDSIEDLCTCKPCGCLVCTRQTQKECNCKPCQCLECTAISCKKLVIVADQKDCDCSSCQCEDCKENTGHDSVATHEMSTGTEGTLQLCTCALCSYHFCGHQVENESCLCEPQNKFMRKPNASCYRDFDIRTVSLGIRNNKPNILHSKNNSLSVSAHDSRLSEIDKTKTGKKVYKLKFQTCKKSNKYKQIYYCTGHDSEACDYQSDSDSSEKVASPVSLSTDSSSESENTSNKSKDIFLRDKPQLYFETKYNLENSIYTNCAKECKTRLSESIGIQNGSRICQDNSPCSASKEKLANLLFTKPLNKYAHKGPQNDFQIYNIKQYTLKNNSSKLTTSSRNISTGSSKLVQSIIYEICHEILECIIVEATKDVVVKIELGGKSPKSITVLKDAKTKSDEVDFSESSLQLEPTDNKSANIITKRKYNITPTHKNQNDFNQDNEDDLQETNSKIGMFNTNGTKKQSNGGYQDCNFCIIDKSFGNIMLNYDKYNNQGQKYKETERCDLTFLDSEYNMQNPTLLHATKITTIPQYPLKYNWVNTNSWLDNSSQISIHDSNHFEYHNNIFELQAYNIRLENTLKQAKHFSIELMEILHKFEKANKNFKSLSKKLHPIQDSDEGENSSRKERHNKTSSSPKSCPSPLQTSKTSLKSENTNKASRLEMENTDSLKTQEKTALNLGQSICENSYSERILCDERLDKTLSRFNTMKRGYSEPMNSINTGPDSEPGTVGFKDGIGLRANGTSGFREFNGQDDIDENRFYNALNPQQQLLYTSNSSKMRKDFYPNNTRLTTKSIGIPVRPISTFGTMHDDTKSAVVPTGIWDGNTYKKNTYENRALSKSELDNFSNIPIKQRPTYKENMWSTLLKDIDYSYTLPPKHKNENDQKVDKSEFLDPLKKEAPRDYSKDMNRYKDFLKNLEKCPKHPPHEREVLDCKCSSCDALTVGMVAVRRVSNHTAIIKWTAPKIVESILGYEILIDGRGVQKILNPTCGMCVVTCLPYTDAVLVTIRTLTSTAAAHAPASTVVYSTRVK